MTRESRLRIDQCLPSFAPRDAIGYHTLELQRVIRSLGIPSDIYADEIKPEMKGLALPFGHLARRPRNNGRYVIYQTSTGSPMVHRLIEHQEKIIINFHNVTPKDILGRWDRGVGTVVGAGIKQLSMLKDSILGAISVSRFNKWCLAQEGITENSLVACPFIPEHPATEVEVASRIDTHSNWIFVGRIAPNKAQHDIVKAFAAYVEAWDPEATLTLVGSVSSKSYAEALNSVIVDLNVQSRVRLLSGLDANQLQSEYQRASVFVCLSDHEGFGFPIVEAMRYGLPVVAYASTGVTETVGTAGILVSDKNPLNIAGAVAVVENRSDLRSDLGARMRTRSERYSAKTAEKENLDALSTLIPDLKKVI